MEAWVRFSAQSQARERLLRAAQYACVLAGAALSRSGGGSGSLSRLQQLEAHLSLGRKLLRLGGSAEALGGAQRSLHLPDPVLRFCLTLSHLNRALFLACDNLLWAGKSGVLPHLDTQKWSQRAFRYHLFALLVNLTRDAYELRQLLEKYHLFALLVNLTRDAYELRQLLERAEAARRRGKGAESAARPPARGRLQHLRLLLQLQLQLLLQVLRDNPPVLLDLLRNACDLVIPLEKLGMCRSGPAIVGVCGLVSSLLSILTILHPWLKLKP